MPTPTHLRAEYLDHLLRLMAIDLACRGSRWPLARCRFSENGRGATLPLDAICRTLVRWRADAAF